MSLTLFESNTTDYTPPEAGTFTARLASLIDLGTQTSVWEGEEKRAHKVLLSFEITDAENRRSDDSPHTISKRFTASRRSSPATTQGAGEIFGGPWNGNQSVSHAQKICPVAKNVKALTSPKNAL